MIRVRRGTREHAAHTDDWLITYADMITLLLCFFVIFYVMLSARKNGQLEAPEAGYTAYRAQLSRQAPARVSPAHVAQRDLTSGTLGEFNLSQLIPAPVAATAEPENAGVGPISSSSGTDSNAKEIANSSESQEKPDIESKGDRISAFEMSGSALFDSGSSTLRESGKSILRGVAVQLESDRYDGYQIVVEGHTDDAPIATQQFSSNWELSMGRAAAVVHFLLDQGIPATKLRAAAYGDTRPKVPNRDVNGNVIPGNQAENRRVIVKLEKIETEE
jgi:flagellar motor protein MotB